jgi:uncharacterized protein
VTVVGQGLSATPAFWPAGVRETHSGVVILMGDRAYKIKKPVDLGFLDFRTPQARRRACRRELELNRRLAPDVYLDLATVSGSDRRVVEHAVVMRRMPDALRLSTMIRDGTDVDDHLRALARLIADFHAAARRGPRIAAEGGAAALRRRWSNNLREAAAFRGTTLDADLHRAIERLSLAYIDGREPLLAGRVAAGLSVDGHGDLIAEDIFCLPDYPRVLDCLEFDDRLRWVDVLDDVAFLAMDLEQLGRPELAERFLGWYSELSGIPTVSSLQHHYIAYRAFVRAKVACIRGGQGVRESAGEAETLACLALRHLRAGEVKLVLVGGGPGTGKTTLAADLADGLGGVLLSTDSIRKELPTIPAEDRYSDGAKAATYRELLARARLALEHGESVVADATWGSSPLRQIAAELATTTASRIVMLECRLPTEIAAARAQDRLGRTVNASDAGDQVARNLAALRDPWPDAIGIDTRSALDALRAANTALATD